MNQHTRVQAPLPFIDVAAQRRRLGSRIDDAIARVVNHCQFINGPEVRELERDLSAFCGAKHSIGVSSGTDALAEAAALRRDIDEWERSLDTRVLVHCKSKFGVLPVSRMFLSANRYPPRHNMR